ncbi:MAG: DNA gyrase inhibitor YacG [Dissulfuribacterales bacterium]
MIPLESDSARSEQAPSVRIRPCPVCNTLVNFDENPYRPFCSRRCKLIDLSAWLTGEHFGLTEEEMRQLPDAEQEGD